MMVYKDKTFCNASCKAVCNDKITNQILREAKKFSLPVSIMDLSQGCKKYKKGDSYVRVN